MKKITLFTFRFELSGDLTSLVQQNNVINVLHDTLESNFGTVLTSTTSAELMEDEE